MLHDAMYASAQNFVDLMLEEVTQLPKPGTPAAQLTDNQKFALAVAYGAPYRTWFDAGRLRFETTVPVGIADKGDGSWVVAIGARPPRFNA